MTRRDDGYWGRLRKDRRSATAAGLAIVTVITSSLSLLSVVVPDVPAQARGNPLYWLIVVPGARWSAGLARYEAAAVRSWATALLLASGTGIAAAAAMHEGSRVTAQMVACAVTLSTSAASFLTYRGSMVQREGPAR